MNTFHYMLGCIYLYSWVSVYNKQLVVHEGKKTQHYKEKEICKNMTGREQNLKALRVSVCIWERQS